MAGLKIKTDYDIGDTLYIINDPDQYPHTVVGVIVLPGAIKYILSYLGDECEVYNFELAPKKNPLIDAPPKDEDN